LLVSVREPGEVEAALDGGADIIDVKDPARGALGAADAATLVQVLERVPATIPFSAALGDPRNAASAAGLVGELPVPPRLATTFVKLGVAGVESALAAEGMLRAAVDAARRHPARPRVIAVAYADAEPNGLDLGAIAALAQRAGALGVLVDTLRKDGGSLLDSLPPAQLRAWIADAHHLSLLVALAGSLDRAELELVGSCGADVVGVRGAACEGGRVGRVSTAKVRRLRAAIAGVAEDRDCAAKHQSLAWSAGSSKAPN
jgi:hypothetical protein